jgi:hypothetical protein
MKRLCTVCLLWILLSAVGFGQTKIFLKDSASALGLTAASAAAQGGCGNGSNGSWTLRLADPTQGLSTVTRTWAPTSTAPPCAFQTATSNGQYLRWITAPLSAGFTLSGNINYSAGCAESATATNAGIRFVVSRWSAQRGGIVSVVHTSADSTECGTTAALRTIAAAAPTSTTFVAGDRLVIVVEARAVGGTWGGNGSRTISLLYGGLTTTTGDAFANFADTFTFASDTNNAPARAISFRRPLPTDIFNLTWLTEYL